MPCQRILVEKADKSALTRRRVDVHSRGQGVQLHLGQPVVLPAWSSRPDIWLNVEEDAPQFFTHHLALKCEHSLCDISIKGSRCCFCTMIDGLLYHRPKDRGAAQWCIVLTKNKRSLNQVVGYEAKSSELTTITARPECCASSCMYADGLNSRRVLALSSQGEKTSLNRKRSRAR